MRIHLIHQSKIVETCLSLYLQKKGYHVVLKKMSNYFVSDDIVELNSLLLLDANYLNLLEKGRIEQLCKVYNTIALLGHLTQMHLFFNICTTQGGYIYDREEARQLLKTVQKLDHQEFSFSPKISEFICQSSLKRQAILFQDEPTKHLTKTELNVMWQIAEGKTTQEIAENWHRSPHTIYNHRKNVMKKLKLNGTFRLTKFCYDKKDAILTLLSLLKNKQFIQGLPKNNQR